MTLSKRTLYKMQDLTTLLKVTPRTIRYYDQVGLLPHVKRSDGGMRLFDDEDIDLIKKIRHLQKKELSLEAIKKKLFNKKKLSSQDMIIVTDSGAIISNQTLTQLPIRVFPLTCRIGNTSLSLKDSQSPSSIWKKATPNKTNPLTQLPTVENLTDFYLSLAKEGYKKVYALHSGGSFFDIISLAKKAAKNVKSTLQVTVIDSGTFGAGLGLFVTTIATALANSRSTEELDLLINKQLPLIYQVGILQNLDFLLDTHHPPRKSRVQSQLFSELTSFIPLFLFKNQSQKLTIEGFFPTQERAFSHILDLLETEFITRGKYMTRFMVSYHEAKKDATSLYKSLCTRFGGIPSSLTEMSGTASVEYGPHSITVSIL